MIIRYDCIHFRGEMPCTPHKKDGEVCDTCMSYTPVEKRILIIKLGAIGDVIRTTPLAKKYRQLYPDSQITWLTLHPQVLPSDEIDDILVLNAISLFRLQHQTFDIAVNLDKEKEACMLLADVQASEKYGFTFQDNHIDVATVDAQHKLYTGLFDTISKANTKSYLEEIFEICQLKFSGEEYLIAKDNNLFHKWASELKGKAKGQKIIGLNTGCGARWKTRIWPDEYWVKLITQLHQAGHFCLLLGGEQEHNRNIEYAKLSGVHYAGFFPLNEFIALSDVCDVVVTQVSMMMHIAVALQKKLVLLNNIFNAHEFDLYNRGVIIEPESGCDCYYGNTCTRKESCMYEIKPDLVYQSIQSFVV